jgi:hypothetical protein
VSVMQIANIYDTSAFFRWYIKSQYYRGMETGAGGGAGLNSQFRVSSSCQGFLYQVALFLYAECIFKIGIQVYRML